MNPRAERPTREILIAMPDELPDLYRMHQQVWQHAERAAAQGVRPAFLFRVEQGLIRARSADFSRGIARAFRPDVEALLDIAAVVQGADGRERSVEAGALPAWTEEKLAGAGFKAHSIEVQSFEVRIGEKRDRATGQPHKINLPVVRLCVRLAVSDQEKALRAWRSGIGRGRRFGLGMLTQ